jgi:hypothetical protein
MKEMEKLPFEKKRTRVKYCPCGKSNKDGKFAPFEGFEDKGFCHSCLELFPHEENENEGKEKDSQKSFSPPPPKPVSFIDPQFMEASLKGYDQNNFVLFLEKTFGKSKAMKAVEAYKIGTSKRWPGSNIFWQIDHNNKIRSGKIMLYDASTGKRQNKNSWVHSVLKLDDFNLDQCLFGSHLINSDPVKNVAIVESEKTAIISSILIHDFIWLASGGKGGLRPEKFQSLKNRNVFLFPDLTKPGDKQNCFELWNEKTKELSNELPGTLFYVSDYLETKATEEEKIQGLDIADYFLKWEWVNVDNVKNVGIQKPFISEDKNNNVDNVENEALEKPFILSQKEDEQIRNIESEINHLSKQIFQVIQGIRREKAKESKFRNEIRNSEIPGEAIRANKELLRKYRLEKGYN